jgi:hypothetical protein
MHRERQEEPAFHESLDTPQDDDSQTALDEAVRRAGKPHSNEGEEVE